MGSCKVWIHLLKKISLIYRRGLLTGIRTFRTTKLCLMTMSKMTLNSASSAKTSSQTSTKNRPAYNQNRKSLTPTLAKIRA